MADYADQYSDRSEPSRASSLRPSIGHQLTINLKMANALGLDVPPSLLAIVGIRTSCRLPLSRPLGVKWIIMLSARIRDRAVGAPAAADTDSRVNRSIPPIHSNLPLESDRPSASDFASRLINGPRLIVASHWHCAFLLRRDQYGLCGCRFATGTASRESLVKPNECGPERAPHVQHGL